MNLFNPNYATLVVHPLRWMLISLWDYNICFIIFFDHQSMNWQSCKYSKNDELHDQQRYYSENECLSLFLPTCILWLYPHISSLEALPQWLPVCEDIYSYMNTALWGTEFSTHPDQMNNLNQWDILPFSHECLVVSL